MRKILNLLCGLMMLAASQLHAQDDILFVMIDDMSSNLVGYLSEEPESFLQTLYPDSETRQAVAQRLTPNMNALAAQSATYSRMMSSVAICNGSRTAMLTGFRGCDSRLTSNNVYFRDRTGAIGTATTLPQMLQAAGYETTGIGKIFHRQFNHNSGDYDPASWDHIVDSRIGTGGGVITSPYQMSNTIKFGLYHNQPVAWSHDYWNGSFAGNFLRDGTAIRDGNTYTNNGDPMAVFYGIYRPHGPHYCSKDAYDLFPISEMTGITDRWVDYQVADRADLGPEGNFHAGGGQFDLIYNAHGVTGVREFIAHFLGCIHYADACLGRALQDVDLTNTMVVVVGDHGFALGNKKHFQKHSFWPVETDTFMIINDPRGTWAPGTVIKNTVSMMDIYPTLAGYAGQPHTVKGNDLAVGGDFLPICTLNLTKHCIQIGDWRLIDYDTGEYELYNTYLDPFCTNNVANDPAMGQTLAELIAILDAELAR